LNCFFLRQPGFRGRSSGELVAVELGQKSERERRDVEPVEPVTPMIQVDERSKTFGGGSSYLLYNSSGC